MDLEKESSSVVMAISCIPPPPPPPPMLNSSAKNDGRTQLFADICKAAALKKASVINDSSDLSSPRDKLKKQTQDLLQAELTDTLKRRKPMMITEPPKYEFPNYDNRCINMNTIYESNNSSSNDKNNNKITNKINDSSHSMEFSENNTRPSNTSAVLSAVSGIKLPNVQYDANAFEKSSQSADKSCISHGKPNFTIHRKENKPISSAKNAPISPTFQFKPLETAQVKLKRPSYFIGNIVPNNKTANKPVEVKTIPNVNGDAEESQVEKCKSIFKMKSQQSIEPGTPTSLKCQPKSDVILKSENSKPSNGIEPINQTIHTQKSMDETVDDLSYESFANRKALFEKPAQNGNITKILLRNVQAEKSFLNKITILPTVNGRMHMFNGNQNDNGLPKPNITKVTLNKDSQFESLEKPTNKDENNNFERSIPKIGQTMTTNAPDKQFKHKTIVSFLRDQNAPDPGQIGVKRTIVTQHTQAIPDNPFNNLRFSIKVDGQVIPKIK